MDYREKSCPDLTKEGILPIAQKEKTARRTNKVVLFDRQGLDACTHGIVGITREGWHMIPNGFEWLFSPR